MRLNIMRIILAVAMILAFATTPLLAQGLAWVEVYNNGSDDVAHSIAVATNGYAYVTGTSNNGSTLDAFILKVDVYTGDVIWKKSFDNGGNNDESFGIALANSTGNPYVISTSGNGTNTDFRTLLLSASDGTISANKVYDSGSNDACYGLTVASDASFVYVVGSSFNGTDDDWRIMKYNGTLAAEQWGVVTYDGGFTDVARACTLDLYGNLYVTGYSSNAGIRTIRYSSSGAVKWSSLAGTNGNQAFGIAADLYGDVIIAGVSSGASGTDFRVIKYKGADGSVLWDKTYDSGGADFARGVTTDKFGDVYVVGYSVSGNSNLRIVKFDGADGTQLMTKVYDSDSSDDGWGIVVDSRLNMYIAGVTGSGVGQDYLILKYGEGVEDDDGSDTLLSQLLRQCGALGLDAIIFVGSIYWISRRFRRARY